MKIVDREKIHYLANGKKLSSMENYPVKDMTILKMIDGICNSISKADQSTLRMG